WADAHLAATGAWPTLASGPVRDVPRENWANLDTLLRVGQRGLPGGSSIARLREEYRQVRKLNRREPLAVEQVLAWADAHHTATGDWPDGKSGPVSDASAPEGLTWRGVDAALKRGGRGLPGASSLAQLLAERRAVRPPLTLERILAWADAYHAATGRWPRLNSGPVAGVCRES